MLIAVIVSSLPMRTCIAVGLVVLCPLLGRSATAPGHQRRLMLLAMLTLDAVTGIWMLLQYAYEVWVWLGFSSRVPSITCVL